MRLGLGTGSTASHFVRLLGGRLRAGELSDITGVPTSERTRLQALAEGIPLAELDELAPLDLTVDGADEIDPGLDLIKGLGGALLREKIVAVASTRLLIIADDSKRVDRLGQTAPVPVEVVPFGWRAHLPLLESMGARPVLREHDGEPLRTDNCNFLVDCWFEGGIPDPRVFAESLRARVGIVESGLFLGLAHEAILVTPLGVESLQRPSGAASASVDGTAWSGT